jgi:uncharacterized SAM-binding protein YcdF (DUF218 family)
MFFILSKLLAFLFSPFLWFLISFFAFLLLKNEKWKLRLKRISIFILIFFSLGFPLKFLVARWEVAGTRIEKVGNYELGVVLSGMAEYNKDLNVLSARRGIDRIWQTISLYKKGKIKKILISGDSGYVIRKGLHEADQLKEVLVKWGIPSEDVIVENKSKNTYENAQFTGDMMKKYKYKKKFLLITSALHMPRSKACYDKAGLPTTIYPTDYYSQHSDNLFKLFFEPSSSKLYAWEALLHEWIGVITYKIKGYN